MNNPLISIITPSYNQGQFIRETIESVLNQDYPNVEYIIVDGESNDETLDILKSYGNRITFISEKDEGQADAVNKGILIARGEIIGWLNSDDTYLPGAIKCAVEYLTRNEHAGFVYGEGYHIDKTGQIMERYPTEKFDQKRLSENCIICQPTVFIRKSVFKNIGLLDKKLHYCMDYELWLRIAKQYPIGYIPNYLANSRMYAENKTLSNRVEVHREAIYVVKKHYKVVPLNWVYGYCYFLNDEKKNFKFFALLLVLFFRYNINNIKFCFEEILKVLYKIIRRTKEKW